MIKLTTNTAYVWHVNLNIQPIYRDYFWSLLSRDEKSRAACFRYPQRRERFVAARGILRYLLGQLLGESPHKLKFIYSAQGKPSLQTDRSLHFNLTHAQEKAVYAIMLDSTLGIDIEYINPKCRIDLVAARFLSGKEYHLLQALVGYDKLVAFFRMWVQKEAILKALGLGLFDPLIHIKIQFSADTMRWIIKDESKLEPEIWRLSSITCPENFVGALAVPDACRQLKLYSLAF